MIKTYKNINGEQVAICPLCNTATILGDVWTDELTTDDVLRKCPRCYNNVLENRMNNPRFFKHVADEDYNRTSPLKQSY